MTCQFTKIDGLQCKRNVAGPGKLCWQQAKGWRKKLKSLTRNQTVLFFLAVLSLVLGVPSVVLGYKSYLSQGSLRALDDPVLHLDPESALLWSTGTKEKMGLFALTLANTGLMDTDTINATEDFFVVQCAPSSKVIIRSLGEKSIAIPQLGSKQKAPLSVDFGAYEEISRQLMMDNDGPSLLGVYIRVSYRRKADGRNFTLTSAFAALNPKAPGIYPAGSKWDKSSGPGVVGVTSDGHNWFTDSINAGISTTALNRGKPRLLDVVPLLKDPDSWTPVTTTIKLGPDGKTIVMRY
jgi:hypothetical protein